MWTLLIVHNYLEFVISKSYQKRGEPRIKFALDTKAIVAYKGLKKRED